MTDGDGNPTEPKKIDKKWVVETILPCHRVHLVAAPVGIGKTTLLAQQCEAMQGSAQFLGFQAAPRSIVYLAADRDREETKETLIRLGITGLKIKEIYLDEFGPVHPFLESIIDQHTKPDDLFIVEPIMHFLRDPINRPGDLNHYGHVTNWLSRVKACVIKHRITLEGSIHATKSKVGEEYVATRDKILGSTAWGAYTSTVIFIAPVDPKDPTDPYRTITVLPRNHKPIVLNYQVEQERGLLVPARKKTTNDLHAYLDSELAKWPLEIPITTETVLEWAEMIDASRATAFRWLKDKIENGQLDQIGHGKFLKLQTN